MDDSITNLKDFGGGGAVLEALLVHLGHALGCLGRTWSDDVAILVSC